MKILIVEDEVIPANYLKRLLELEGYEVLETVETGKEAIKVAKKETPDVVLMDIMLEDNISGCDAALEINHHNPDIRIIFLTAYSDKEMIEYAIASHAYGYLLKPYRDKEILATLALLNAQLTQQTNDEYHELPSCDPEVVMLVGNYSYHKHMQNLFLSKKEIPLGPQAIKLIDLLCQHQDYTLDIDNILYRLWDNQRSKQALRSLVYRIRIATIPELILNASKTGYKLGLKNI